MDKLEIGEFYYFKVYDEFLKVVAVVKELREDHYYVRVLPFNGYRECNAKVPFDRDLSDVRLLTEAELLIYGPF